MQRIEPMKARVKAIYAFGTRGDQVNVRFEAKAEPCGGYALHRKVRKTSVNQTNKAENKVIVSSLDEAAELVRTGDFLISLKQGKGPRSLRDHKKLMIIEE
jgi:hypothetical protein